MLRVHVQNHIRRFILLTLHYLYTFAYIFSPNLLPKLFSTIDSIRIIHDDSSINDSANELFETRLTRKTRWNKKYREREKKEEENWKKNK